LSSREPPRILHPEKPPAEIEEIGSGIFDGNEKLLEGSIFKELH
jgi:hypothetical protein